MTDMENKTHIRWVWTIAILALVLAGVLSAIPGVAARSAAAALDSASPTATTVSSVAAVPSAAVVPPAASLDEQQAVNALEALIVGVYDDTSPAVVNITNRSYVYYRFMGSVPEEGTGSGFVYDTEGHIVTNYHVIENADELLVTLAGGQVYTANVVGSDPTNDLAVLQIDAGDALPSPLLMGDSGALRVGQFVLAIGNPYGLQQTLTTGVVSALGRVIESPQNNSFIGEAIQTDAAINPGNSGGPLLDLQGRVIGVNSQIISPSGASAGIGFAVSAKTVQRVVPVLIAHGYYAHPWLGTEMLSLTGSVASVLREAGAQVPTDSGILVIDAVQGGPAARAGIQGGSRWVRVGRYQVPVGGDIITAVDGRPTDDLQALTVYLETEKTIGDEVELTILRGEQQLVIPVTLAEQPQA
jgi:S1-C subfamily serine protease